MMKKDKKFKFSVVMPIYNVEPYLDEAIQSILNQTIGFKKNIQIVLVNDGSPDGSGEICEKYAKNYPENIKYIKQENRGVSAARNRGMKEVEGKYVGFLDPDDKYDKEVFARVWNFFKKYKTEIDLVACRVKFFGARSGYHPLDYKFKDGDRVVNIENEYENIQLHVSSFFVKNESLKNKKFDEKFKVSEDAKFLAELILDKKKYGVLKTALHMYRKRMGGAASALQLANENGCYEKGWLRNYLIDLIGQFKDQDGKIPKYLQYQIIYELKWRISSQIKDEELRKKFKEDYQKILQFVDDEIILEHKKLCSEERIFLFKIKGEENKLECREKGIYYVDGDNERILYNATKRSVEITSLDFEQNFLDLRGLFCLPFNDGDYSLVVLQEKKKGDVLVLTPIEIGGVVESKSRKAFTKDFFFEKRGFRVRIPVSKNMKISILLVRNGMEETRFKVMWNFGRFGKLNRGVEETYYSKKKWLVHRQGKDLIIEINDKKTHLTYEGRYIKWLLKNKDYSAVNWRLWYNQAKPKKKNQLWVISDRPTVANDNGAAFFEYLCKIRPRGIDFYLTVDKGTESYEKYKKTGRVIDRQSVEYKKKYLLADKIISSQADESIIRFPGKEWWRLRDLEKFDFVFLQHGVTQNNLSAWLNAWNKNMKLFVITSNAERASILDPKYNYGYKEEELILSGLPRYDLLHSDENPTYVTIAPTWRHYLSTISDVNGHREYSEKIKESDFFKFYNRLINDERIEKCLEKYNLKGRFILHPSFTPNKKDFKNNKFFEVATDANYNQIFADSKLFITDYSSTAFDFAYLKKPIIYTQFDKDVFFTNHTMKPGYFDYEKDAFGPIVYNYEDTVKEIIKTIEDGCKMPKKYQDRVDKTFAFHDKNNCERIYKAILGLDGGEE